MRNLYSGQAFAYVQNLRIPNEYAIGLYIVKICEAAQKLGYQTHLVIPLRTQPDYFPHRSIWKYYKIPSHFFVVQKITVREFLHLPGWIESIYVHFRHQVIVWTFFTRAVWYLSKHNIQIVESIDREIIFLLRLVWWYRPVIIYDVHIDPKTWYEKLLDFLIIPRVNLFMVNCHFFQDYYAKKIHPGQKILVLANGYDPKHYTSLKTSEIRKRLKLPKDRFIIGYIGRFDTMGMEKGVDDMIRAVAALQREIPVSVLAVGGPKHLAEKYRSMAKELGLSDVQALIWDQVEPDQVGSIIQCFDVSCILYPDTPHYRYKMSPMKAVEYMAAGKVILATDLPSIRELISADRGYLVKPGSLKQLTSMIRYIYNHPEEASQKARHAFVYGQRYTWENRQKTIFDFLPVVSQ